MDRYSQSNTFQIKKEGESLEFKCRLEEDYEEGEVKMTWYFNDQVIEAGDRYMITFDGTYATLFIASCVMADMGEYKVVFENSAGTDETTGKVTVKPVSTFIRSKMTEQKISKLKKTLEFRVGYYLCLS